jgi:hypothetical protein
MDRCAAAKAARCRGEAVEAAKLLDRRREVLIVPFSLPGTHPPRSSERDANEILATLYTSGIHAAKSSRDEKTWSVQVDESDLQRALVLVNQHGLPHEQFSSTGELFKKEGLISTPSEESTGTPRGSAR